MSAPPEQLRAALKAAQRELSIIARDAIYRTDKLCGLLYEVLPAMCARLAEERSELTTQFGDTIDTVTTREQP